MKRSERRRGTVGRPWMIAASAALLCACVAYAADLDTTANPLLVDAQVGGVTYSTGPNGAITISFAAQSLSGPPGFSFISTVADVGVAEGAFVGDYTAAGIRALTFRITSDGHLPGSIMVFLKNRDGRAWCNPNVQVSADAGLVVINGISFDRSAGWDRNERPTVDKNAMWLNDLKDVGVIGIRISQGGAAAQSYTISDFALIDQIGGTGGNGTLTPLEQALLAAFGVASEDALDDAQRAQDVDGDGMPDIIEILSELEAGFADSIFVAEIVDIEAEGITIRWACVNGEWYTVLRSESLFTAFAPLPDATRLEATDTGYMTHTDTTTAGSGPYFYKILKQQE